MAADEYADIMRARLAKAGFCWEWVAVHGDRRPGRVEVGEAQEGLFGRAWAFGKGVWGAREGGGREGEVGPRGERVEEL